MSRGALRLTRAAAQVATPLQQAKCELMAFPWTPDVLAMCNLLAAHAGGLADVKRGYEQLAAKGPAQQPHMPFNCLLMPELASLQDRARPAAPAQAFPLVPRFIPPLFRLVMQASWVAGR